MVSDVPEVPRGVLRDAIEAGIVAAAARPWFTAQQAERLWQAGSAMRECAVGAYAELQGGRVVRCPVAWAFPAFPSLRWDLIFATAFDRVMRDATRSTPRAVAVRVVDDPEVVA